MKKRIRSCSLCGYSTNDWHQFGFAGCARCYDEFGVLAEQAIACTNGRMRHCGKIPLVNNPSRISKKEILVEEPGFPAAQKHECSLPGSQYTGGIKEKLHLKQNLEDGLFPSVREFTGNGQGGISYRKGRTTDTTSAFVSSRPLPEMSHSLWRNVNGMERAIHGFSSEMAGISSSFQKFVTNKTRPQDGIVFNVRLRLARNLASYPFPHQMSIEQGWDVAEEVVSCVRSLFGRKADVFLMDALSQEACRFLVEQHIVSPEFAEPGIARCLVCLPDGVRILVNEEDHIRLYLDCKPDQMVAAWDILNALDDRIGADVTFAFHRFYGYLTSCPTNVGTGLRVSALMCLPALHITGQLKDLLSALDCQDVLVRGFYGEGTGNLGSIYQISTGPNLGKTEIDICKEFEAVINTIIDRERCAAQKIRAGYVRTCINKFMTWLHQTRTVSFHSGIELVTLLLLGQNLGIIQVEGQTLAELFYSVLPASLCVDEGRVLKGAGFGHARAGLIKRRLQELGIY